MDKLVFRAAAKMSCFVQPTVQNADIYMYSFGRRFCPSFTTVSLVLSVKDKLVLTDFHGISVYL